MLRAIAAVCLVTPALGQPVEDPDLAEIATPIASIDPMHTEFDDLAFLHEAIGDARMVVLGEQSHGEGTVFLAKARLVKFLHQEMDFDVLCWESGMLGCMEMNDLLADETKSLSDAFAGVFPIWTRSAQVRPTLEYARASLATDRPITQCGMDAQVNSALGTNALQPRVQALLDTLQGVIVPAEATAGLELLKTMTGGMRPDLERVRQISTSLHALATLLDEHMETLREHNDKRELELIYRSVDDAAWATKFMASQLAGERMEDNPDLIRERDRRMGDNLAWLAETYYPDRKIIVWAATRHAVHRQKEIEYPDAPGMYDEMDSMGETAFVRLGEDLYTIGFTAGRGEVSNVFRNQPYDIGEPREDSIEASLDAIGHPFLFVDFRALPPEHALRKTQWMRPLGYAWQRAIWPHQMDAVIYLDRVFPSTAAESVPADFKLTVDGS